MEHIIIAGDRMMGSVVFEEVSGSLWKMGDYFLSSADYVLPVLTYGTTLISHKAGRAFLEGANS